MRGEIWAVSAFATLAATALAGCEDQASHLPPIFHIDEIRHWWEGDELVVNVTFTNQANFTAGYNALSPDISVLVREMVPNGEGGRIGEKTKQIYLDGAQDDIGVTLATYPSGPWQKRWHQHDEVGPILIPPGRTLSMEFGFKPGTHFTTASDGYYVIEVLLPSWYPHDPAREKEFQIADDAHYTTGCFNHVVSEYYGLKQGLLDCGIWDCTGQDTNYGYAVLRDGPLKYRATCTATNATGPY